MAKTTLEYSTLPKPRFFTPKLWLRVAIFCGAAPLLAGIAVAGLYLLTYNRGLETAGLITVFVGVPMVLIGAIAWLVYRFTSKQKSWHAVAVVLLLAANFPGCAVCVYAVHLWRFTVVNHSASTITSVIISTSDGAQRKLGPIEPGRRGRIYWRLGDDEGETFTITTTGGTGATATFDTYTAGTSGEDIVITINPNGTLTTP